jgi:hypothetical protein
MGMLISGFSYPNNVCLSLRPPDQKIVQNVAKIIGALFTGAIVITIKELK